MIAVSRPARHNALPILASRPLHGRIRGRWAAHSVGCHKCGVFAALVNCSASIPYLFSTRMFSGPRHSLPREDLARRRQKAANKLSRGIAAARQGVDRGAALRRRGRGGRWLHRLCAIIHDDPEQAKAGFAGELSSSLRHSGLAQAGVVSGLEQGPDLRHAPILGGPQMGDARITIVASQFACVGVFCVGVVGLARKRIGRGEVGVRRRTGGTRRARFVGDSPLEESGFEPSVPL